MDSELFIKLVSSIASLAIILITSFVIPWIKSKMGIEKYDFLIDKIEKAVRAAKQIFSDDPKDNQSKKEYCINYVKALTDKMDIELTSEEISLLIEGIYGKIKEETKNL